MRISTSMMFTLGVDAIERQQGELQLTQQQIATGKRILSAADDPVGAAQALTVAQAQNQNDQFIANIGTAKTALSMNDSLLGQISDLLQSVRTSAVNGGSGVLADSDRRAIAGDVSARLQELLGLANSKDGNGRAMFGGFQIDAQPFVDNGAGAIVYNGDQGVRELRVSPGRSLAISLAGSTVFENVKNGSGAVTTSATSTNTGTGVANAGAVITPAAVNGHSYSIQFLVAGGVTTYSVVDSTSGTTLSAGNAYTDGAAINVGGMQFSVTGAPASGDSFRVGPSAQQSIFTTLQQLVSVLQAPVANATDRAELANGIGRSLQDLDQALGNVLAARAGVGASLRELDALSDSSDDRAEQYTQTLSGLRDLDYNKALSDFARQQLALDAAQKSFIKLSGLSLFNYL